MSLERLLLILYLEQKLAAEIDSYFRESLIYKRNRRMAGRVIGKI